MELTTSVEISRHGTTYYSPEYYDRILHNRRHCVDRFRFSVAVCSKLEWIGANNSSSVNLYLVYIIGT